MGSYDVTTKSTKTTESLNCICGGESEVRAGNGSGYSGSASVRCKRCGLSMTESHNSVGWGGITIDGLALTVIGRWNRVMSTNK